MKTMKSCTRALAVLLAAAMLALPVCADTAYYVNPEKPYDAPVHGMFHEQPAKSETAPGIYSVYIPETLQPWRPVVAVLAPDRQSAELFTATEQGRAWIATADKYQFALAFLQSEKGDWNTTDRADGRNEPEYFKTVYSQLRSKSSKQDVTFTTDKSHISIVGYGAGGAAAQVIASAYPAIFANLVAVDTPEASAQVLAKYGAQYSFPFPADTFNGQQELNLLNKKIPLPVWLIGDSFFNEKAENYWINVNQAEKSSAVGYASTAYENRDANSRVWISRGHLASQTTPELIWTEFMSKNGRFLGYAGGDLYDTEQFATRQDSSGYRFNEEMIDGKIRRWLTYVPTKYTGKTDVPLVMVMHGYSATMYALAEESHWADVADKYGFIVVFPQGYLNERNGDFVPVPTWNSGLFPLGAGATDDVSFLHQVIGMTEKGYAIDPTRVYATGHSNGGSMTWELGGKMPETFAAIAPVGLMSPGLATDDMTLRMPSWSFKGEFDGDGMALDGVTNGPTLAFWKNWNGVAAAKTQKKTDGLYTTYTYPDADGVPLVQYTAVKNTPHAYNPDQSWMIWEDFFSKYSRAADGTTYYNGKPVA